MAKKIVAANWKMHKNPKQAVEYCAALKKALTTSVAAEVIIFTPAFCAVNVSESLKTSSVQWGAQNIYPATHGAFTGENSPSVLKELGAQYVLVGHSERRAIFKETNFDIANKFHFAFEQNLIPMLCIGESLEERKASKVAEVLKIQLGACLEKQKPKSAFVVAYEPVWAIGTGVVANEEQVAEAHELVRNFLTELIGSEANNTPILYGGSVKADNAKSLAQVKNVDGFLVGGASLEVSTFLPIIEVYK